MAVVGGSRQVRVGAGPNPSHSREVKFAVLGYLGKARSIAAPLDQNAAWSWTRPWWPSSESAESAFSLSMK